ncbi:unnamed protein product [Protopolystoma xenopodis]|uniref:Uncharacterized protein n=1 Tax=Protopolystoma xenopodis TaxID=117903 RepID=A0A3S5AAW5_9PLAT|nr:unnamed protein product [Protopolystoma xenopodis]
MLANPHWGAETNAVWAAGNWGEVMLSCVKSGTGAPWGRKDGSERKRATDPSKGSRSVDRGAKRRSDRTRLLREESGRTREQENRRTGEEEKRKRGEEEKRRRGEEERRRRGNHEKGRAGKRAHWETGTSFRPIDCERGALVFITKWRLSVSLYNLASPRPASDESGLSGRGQSPLALDFFSMHPRSPQLLCHTYTYTYTHLLSRRIGVTGPRARSRFRPIPIRIPIPVPVPVPVPVSVPISIGEQVLFNSLDTTAPTLNRLHLLLLSSSSSSSSSSRLFCTRPDSLSLRERDNFVSGQRFSPQPHSRRHTSTPPPASNHRFGLPPTLAHTRPQSFRCRHSHFTPSVSMQTRSEATSSPSTLTSPSSSPSPSPSPFAKPSSQPLPAVAAASGRLSLSEPSKLNSFALPDVNDDVDVDANVNGDAELTTASRTDGPRASVQLHAARSGYFDFASPLASHSHTHPHLPPHSPSPSPSPSPLPLPVFSLPASPPIHDTVAGSAASRGCPKRPAATAEVKTDRLSPARVRCETGFYIHSLLQPAASWPSHEPKLESAPPAGGQQPRRTTLFPGKSDSRCGPGWTQFWSRFLPSLGRWEAASDSNRTKKPVCQFSHFKPARNYVPTLPTPAVDPSGASKSGRRM